MKKKQVAATIRTLAKFHGGPLGVHKDGFYDWLLKRGYSQNSICVHLSNVSHFNEHLDRYQTVVGRILCSTDVDDFFAAPTSWCWGHTTKKISTILKVRNSIRCFIKYLSEIGQFNPLSQHKVFQPLLDVYLLWMAHYQHVSARTQELRGHDLTVFFEWLGPEATLQGLTTLTPDIVEKFFLAYAQKVGVASRRLMQSSLRTFFRFCLYQGYLDVPLDLAVPILRTYKLASVPYALTDAQAQQVLQGVNRNTCVGRRNYAILQLLFTYGVRSCQVCALRLDQIDWNQNQILFKSAKNGKDSLLPLTPEVGESLLEYLQNSRIPSPFPQVFLTSLAPFHPITDVSVLTAMVSSCIRTAGIDVPHKGTHIFRHTFATRMLQQGHPLKSISDVLGHRQLSTTFIYTKVDFNSLQQVVLDWPEEVPQ